MTLSVLSIGYVVYITPIQRMVNLIRNQVPRVKILNVTAFSRLYTVSKIKNFIVGMVPKEKDSVQCPVSSRLPGL